MAMKYLQNIKIVNTTVIAAMLTACAWNLDTAGFRNLDLKWDELLSIGSETDLEKATERTA